MPYRISYVPTALEHLRGLDARARALVLDSVQEQLTHQPSVPTRNRKLLRSNPVAPWELRVGDLRVFYDVQDPTHSTDEEEDEKIDGVVVILAVGVKRGNRLWLGGEECFL